MKVMTDKGKKIKELLLSLMKRNNTIMNAKDAYLKSKYNRIEDDNTRLKNFKDDLNALIEAKCQISTYCCVVQVEDDLKKFIDDIVQEYKNLGYTVVNLKDVIEGVVSDYLFFTWENAEL